MLLMIEKEHALVEVESMRELTDPFSSFVQISRLRGEEQQDPEPFHKSALCFASGEALPSCWINAHYRDDELKRLATGFDKVWYQAEQLLQNRGGHIASQSQRSGDAFPYYGS